VAAWSARAVTGTHPAAPPQFERGRAPFRAHLRHFAMDVGSCNMDYLFKINESFSLTKAGLQVKALEFEFKSRR
jgi:hypothetical protein